MPTEHTTTKKYRNVRIRTKIKAPQRLQCYDKLPSTDEAFSLSVVNKKILQTYYSEQTDY